MTAYVPELPDEKDIVAFIRDADKDVRTGDVARAFALKGPARTALRQLLKTLAEDGRIVRTKSKTWRAPDRLPETMNIEITGLDGDGELRAKPVEWEGDGPEPVIYVKHKRRGDDAMQEGARMVARLTRIDRHSYEARILKAPNTRDQINQILGIFNPIKGGGIVTPTDKKIKNEFFIPKDFMKDAGKGDLVLIEDIPPTAKMPRSKNPARVMEVLGAYDDPKLISLIAIHAHGIPVPFPGPVLKEADGLKAPRVSKNREDLRDVPLVTIDGADARDFDDAVFAQLDDNPKNKGGWHLIVAIADVSYYVRPGSKLDIEAVKRGNSTYFPDRVVPMLPEKLSNDLCSLRPNVNRAAMVAHLWIDKDGKLIKHIFTRALIRSAARLTYEQVEDAHRGNPDDTTAPLMDAVIKPLYKAYSILKRARELRGALELDLPERKVIIDKKGHVTGIVPRQRLDSHQLIEEFMILANVAAARALEDKNAPCVYRIHDSPAFDRLETTRDFLKDFGLSLPKSDNVHPKDINHILKKTMDRPDKDLIHTVLLRTQSQAVYSDSNIGHFGLSLAKYAHFTSPIRRYADLIVHRSLTRSYNLGDGKLTPDEEENLTETCAHISNTERRSMLAERDATDRFTAQYLSANVGQIFPGKISGVTRFGLFVSLDDSGADGIVPIRTLPRDYYVHDEKRHALVGKDTGRTFHLADPVMVRLVEADPMRASTVFELVTGIDDPPQKKRTSKDMQRRKYAQRKKSNGKNKKQKSKKRR